MMHRIMSSSVRLRTLVVAVSAMLLVAGFWRVRDMPLDVIPEFSTLSLQVRTEALGLSTAEVESLITVPMEAVCVRSGEFYMTCDACMGALQEPGARVL